MSFFYGAFLQFHIIIPSMEKSKFNFKKKSNIIVYGRILIKTDWVLFINYLRSL